MGPKAQDEPRTHPSHAGRPKVTEKQGSQTLRQEAKLGKVEHGEGISEANKNKLGTMIPIMLAIQEAKTER